MSKFNIKKLIEVVRDLECLIDEASYYGDYATVAWYTPALWANQRRLDYARKQARQARPVALLVPLGDLVSLPQL